MKIENSGVKRDQITFVFWEYYAVYEYITVIGDDQEQKRTDDLRQACEFEV